ncbi:MAG: hypothetical protein K0S07_492 [Chlamydiales bacterium]|jgi:chromosome segregation ATPase|nr:hypothetical protein [Chlamydiales bacterium]
MHPIQPSSSPIFLEVCPARKSLSALLIEKEIKNFFSGKEIEEIYKESIHPLERMELSLNHIETKQKIMEFNLNRIQKSNAKLMESIKKRAKTEQPADEKSEGIDLIIQKNSQGQEEFSPSMREDPSETKQLETEDLRLKSAAEEREKNMSAFNTKMSALLTSYDQLDKEVEQLGSKAEKMGNEIDDLNQQAAMLNQGWVDRKRAWAQRCEKIKKRTEEGKKSYEEHMKLREALIESRIEFVKKIDAATKKAVESRERMEEGYRLVMEKFNEVNGSSEQSQSSEVSQQSSQAPLALNSSTTNPLPPVSKDSSNIALNIVSSNKSRATLTGTALEKVYTLFEVIKVCQVSAGKVWNQQKIIIKLSCTFIIVGIFYAALNFKKSASLS